MQSKLSTFIFTKLEKDQYLQELYQKLLEHYSAIVFKKTYEPDYNIEDLLRFADLLSHSIDNKKSEVHKNIAQSIISILAFIYPNNDKILLYQKRILTTVKNYVALKDLRKKDIESYTGDYLMYFLYEEYQKEYQQIPSTENLQFVGPQKEIFENLGKKYFSFSAPTSMGKSFLMRMFMKNKIKNGETKDFAFIVPTKALINETYIKVISDLQKELERKNYQVIRSVNELSKNDKHNHIFIMTPERMLYLLTSTRKCNFGYVFIDESQKISVRDARSTFYYQVVDLLQNQKASPLISFASPNIPNPEIYLNLISKRNIKGAKSIEFSPVNQIYFILDYCSMKVKCFNNLSNDFFDVCYIDNKNIVPAIVFINNRMRDSQSLIYCNTTSDAINYSRKLGEESKDLDDDFLNKLSKKIKNQIHTDYYLSELVRKGIAYHVGYLPEEIRNDIETAYRDKKLKTIFCTSTLMEGVNLPANNLFITSTKNGNRNFDKIDFYNLSGRIGRLDYSRLGNIFLIINDKKDIKKVDSYLTESIPEQSLSVDKIVKEKDIKLIVESLSKGDLTLRSLSSKQTYTNFNTLRKYTLIYLYNLQNNTTGKVRTVFEQYISKDEEQKILQVLNNHFPAQKIDEDINTSLDQSLTIKELIKSGEKFPEIYSDGPRYDETLEFLEKLAQAYNWSKYEPKDLGKLKDNQYKQLRWYTVILIQWISGYGLSNILKKAINYKKNNQHNAIWIKGKYIDYNGSKEHNNLIINDTLKTLQEQILFKISNYFFKYAKEYKKYYNLESLNNDWYEFIEYGTSNELRIWLQKNGYSREVASYIEQNPEYYRYENGKYKLSLKLKDMTEDVGIQTRRILYNKPEIFVENFKNLE